MKSDNRRPASTRLFRILLKLFPFDFRLEHGGEMEQFFRVQYREEKKEGRMAIVRLWLDTLVDFLTTAPREHWDLLRQDLGFAGRTLRKNWGFAAVAVATLALGIGANSGIFGFVDALLLQPMPLEDSDRLVRLYGTSSNHEFDVFSYPNYLDIRSQSQSLPLLAAHRRVPVSLNDGTEASAAQGELVTGNYFETLGVDAQLGRTLRPEDNVAPGGHPLVVISDGFWKRRFGSDPGVVGKSVRINGASYQVVGVAAPGFRGSHAVFPTDVWVPMMMVDQIRRLGVPITRRGWGWLAATGRLAPNVRIEQAQAELDGIADRLQRQHPRTNQGVGFRLHRASVLPEAYRSGVGGFLGVFTLVAGLVLLVACANVAGVMLARAAGRSREAAIRCSLGATHTHLVRLWLTESLLLAFLGGAAGLAVAALTQRGMLTLLAAETSGLTQGFSPQMQLDFRVFLFTAAISVLTALLCGLAPASRAAGASPADSLKQDAGAAATGRRKVRLRNALAVAQVMVSGVILISSGLLLRTLREARAFDPGFNTENLLVTPVNLSAYGYTPEAGRQFFLQLLARLEGLPGTQAASFASLVPLGGGMDQVGYRIPGHEPSPDRLTQSIHTVVVGPNYFQTMEVPIVFGRAFEAGDAKSGAPPVIVVNEAMANRFWAGQDAVGRRIQLGSEGPLLEIVGVARDVKQHSLGEQPEPHVYASFAQAQTSAVHFHIRASANPESLAPLVEEQIRLLNPDIAVAPVRKFSEVLEGPLFPQRALAAVTAVFGLLALLLTSVGLYGILSHGVQQRRREIGVRMVVGAPRAQILWLMIRHGLSLILSGLALGLLGAAAATRFLESLLFGVSSTDPLTFALVSLVLILVGLSACWLPALRATRVDPISALRYE